jgi:ATP-dependent DNA helicase RecG
VTADNISYTRFSRNKSIARVMTEFEWVRELNEGVKKIYSDMADAGLPAPEYIETPNTVKLVLRNNIDERMAHRNKASNEALNEALSGFEEIWEELDEIERGILTCLKTNGKVGRAELEKYTKKSRGTVISRLNNLMEKGIIKVNGDIHDPTRTYELV